jgi:hypothetical protein
VVNEGLVAAALLWDEAVRREKVWVADDLQHTAAGAATIKVFGGWARARGRMGAAACVLCNRRWRLFKNEAGVVDAGLWQVWEVRDAWER